MKLQIKKGFWESLSVLAHTLTTFNKTKYKIVKPWSNARFKRWINSALIVIKDCDIIGQLVNQTCQTSSTIACL